MEKKKNRKGQGKVIYDKKLSEKEKLFCKFLVFKTNFVQSKAAIEAGYEPHTAAKTGSILMSKPKIKKEVYRLKSRITGKFKVTKERLIKELASIAFSNIENHVEFDDAIVKLRPSNEIDNRAIKEVKQNKEGVQIAMYDKHNAIRTLLEYVDESPKDDKDFSVNITVVNSNEELNKDK